MLGRPSGSIALGTMVRSASLSLSEEYFAMTSMISSALAPAIFPSFRESL